MIEAEPTILNSEVMMRMIEIAFAWREKVNSSIQKIFHSIIP
jgi:hypothetical protein